MMKYNKPVINISRFSVNSVIVCSGQEPQNQAENKALEALKDKNTDQNVFLRW